MGKSNERYGFRIVIDSDNLSRLKEISENEDLSITEIVNEKLRETFSGEDSVPIEVVEHENESEDGNEDEEDNSQYVHEEED